MGKPKWRKDMHLTKIKRQVKGRIMPQIWVSPSTKLNSFHINLCGLSDFNMLIVLDIS